MPIRSTGTQLTTEFQRIRETSREAKDDSAAATEAVKEIEKKLGPLVQLQELSKNTEERLASLNALAEHVSQKAKALEAQKHAVERAVVEANRLNEMVWSMDVQIAKLNEGSKHVARAEDTVARMEKLAQETTAQLSSATTAREEFSREFARLDKESRALVGVPEDDASSGSAVDKKEFDQFDHRLRGAVGRDRPKPKRAWTACSRRTSSSSAMNQRADELSKVVPDADGAGRRNGAQAGRARIARRAAGAGRRARPPHAGAARRA